MTESVQLPAPPPAHDPTAEPREPTRETGDASAPAAPFAHHVLHRTIVLPEDRIVFLPMPKAGCTSILWALAELAGIPPETFEKSDLLEPSTALTVHDMTLWGEEHRLAYYEGAERERILSEEGWFRFSTVRNPATRLWSAWQSKLLLREPRFVSTFGEEPWFPRIPRRPRELVDDFRAFVAALGDGGVEDVHWAVQHDLLSQLPLAHVGHVERLDETFALLRAHVGDDRPPSEPRDENRTLIPMPPSAYDAAAAAVLHERYRADFETYGYDRVEPSPDARSLDWEAQIEPLLPALRDTIDKHARIGQLYRLAQRARRVDVVEARLETISTRELGRSNAPVLTNLEGRTDFTVRWSWADADLEPGLTAVVRVKNEARSLPWVLPPLLRAVRRVVLVDNGSTDGTPEVAARIAEEEAALDRFDAVAYPFPVARCGQEHLETPAASVHSLAYFYNWAFSHVRTRYALKWDGDMVLSDAAVDAFRDLAWQLEAAEVVVKVPRYPLYVADERRAFLDVGLRNCEPWAWPNRPGYSFAKAMEWELPLWSADIAMLELPDWSCVELKHLDADEFAHWSPTDFEASSRTQRKRREWEIFQTLADGGDPPAGVIPIEAPTGSDVVEYVRGTWLANRARQAPGFGERVLRQLAEAAA